MSRGAIPVLAGKAETVYPHASVETPFVVCKVNETGLLYSPVWFRTDFEAMTYACRQEGPTMRGRVSS